MKEERIKICHLTSVHNRYDNRIFFKQCCSLNKEGYEVHLVVADGKGDEEKNGVFIWDAGIKKGRFHRIFKTTKKVYQKGLDLDAQLYQFHDPELIPFGLKLLKKDKKVVYDSHEDYRLQIKIKPYINLVVRRILSKFFGIYEDYAVKRFSGVLVPQLSMVEPFYKINKNTKMVANTVDIRDKFEIAEKDYSNSICFHPGTLTKERGLLNMIKAFEHLKKDEKLVIAGPFESQDLMDQAKALPGWKKVDYIGKKPYPEIRDHHKEASIGLILFERVGQYDFAYTVKLFEFMYYGSPVIMPNFGDWVEFNERYQCGVNVDTSNAEDVARQIERLNSDPSLKKKLGSNGHNAILKELNWNHDEQNLFVFYDNLLKIRQSG